MIPNKTSEGQYTFVPWSGSVCFCGKPNAEHPKHKDGIYRVLCTGGIIVMNELSIINRSAEFIEQDHSDWELCQMLEELESRGVSKARFKAKLRKLGERLDVVAEERPRRPQRRKRKE